MRRSRKKRARASGGVWVLALVLTAALMLYALGIFAKPSRLVDRLNAYHATLDLSGGNYRVSPVLAGGQSRREMFSSMISRTKPVAAICGTYYDPDSRPLGDVVVGGKVIYRGGQRQAIGFTSSGKIKFMERQPNSRIDWRGCYSGIACGPRLVRAGKPDVNARRDGFGPAAEKLTARRCAIGATKRGQLIICAVSDWITLSEMAQVMTELGAVDAINLDGGSMCAFYSRGKIRSTPVEPMSNIIGVFRR